MHKLTITLGLLALASAGHAEDVPPPLVTVEQGTVSGVDADGVTAFKGIPFAAPPVGDLRWRAPQPAAMWEGVRNGAAYGHDCMQNYSAVPLPPGSAPSEDCLYVNVWRPSGEATKLPVLVWIYGGGFVNGSASRLIYTGTRLAQQGVMVVSFNYRLGRFGTFAHPALTKVREDGNRLANYGFMDQIAAMEWIKRNVAAFGGDPHNITIMGESAGGMSVHNLVTAPATQGKDLFQRAVVMSGGSGSAIKTATLKDAEAIGLAFAKAERVAANDPQALAKLRAISAKNVTGDIKLGTVLTGGPRTFSSPFPLGDAAADVAAAYKAGRFAKVPTIIGATSGDLGGKDGMMIKGARDLAGTIAAQGVPTWYYRFSYVSDAAVTPKSDGAIHADDLPYFFDTVDIKYGAKTRAADQAMGHTIATYVANFVKAGNPNGKTVPQWPGYAGAGGQMMDFTIDGNAQVGPDTWATPAP
ncbi:carboxylesterase/lipase family protein [Novosphingobium guangzhouense]|uniref:Carboxylic ester hydrolase n=1 Tax=Novosphingobium guangzhouense TaxID=1850347 RepID=A0A2K2FXF9_9SPHN|nr:carboxylesterase family protein [Novosphingobium guangzhouense]PNU03450.1 carboxylesterase [Novosphingobium guangzhouense]